jgi:hypothetical protein
MPSPEHFYQRSAETPTTSPYLQVVITDLAAYYEMNITREGARFSFIRPEQDKQWVIANLDGQHIDVARCPVETDDFMVPDIDVVLVVAQNEWQTTKILHTDAVWEAFAKAAAEKGQPPGDPETQFPFGAFTEFVAYLIEAELRLEQAREAAEVKARLTFK